MATKFLFVGDVHFKHGNATETRVLMDRITTLTYDVAVVAGDVLDTHEKVDVQLLNRAYDTIRALRDRTPTFVLVGNHDYINNQQFLSDAHWMNGMKEWRNVRVVDVPTTWTDNFGQKFVFVPYVFPGRFEEALDTLRGGWKDATCIFAHQEFRGCKMGAFRSTIGDDWDDRFPMVISGHVHERQRHRANVLYPGSVLTHAFSAGESDQSLSVFSFEGGGFTEQRVRLNLESKKTVYVKIGDPIKSRDLDTTTRFVVSGKTSDVEAFKRSGQFRMMKAANVKVVFRPHADDVDVLGEVEDDCVFESILADLVKRERDDALYTDYLYAIRNGNENSDDHRSRAVERVGTERSLGRNASVD